MAFAPEFAGEWRMANDMKIEWKQRKSPRHPRWVVQGFTDMERNTDRRKCNGRSFDMDQHTSRTVQRSARAPITKRSWFNRVGEFRLWVAFAVAVLSHDKFHAKAVSPAVHSLQCSLLSRE